LRRMKDRTRADPALLVRGDWTNTLRGKDFPLPRENAMRASILNADEALEVGATAMVVSFLLGYEESLEADCLKSVVQLAIRGKEIGLPLVVEVLASGPRVSLPGKAVELGASYALEGGADVVVVPYPGRESLTTLGAMLSVPWLVKTPAFEKAAHEWEEAQALGASGLWMDLNWLNSGSALMEIAHRIHKTPVGTGDA